MAIQFDNGKFKTLGGVELTPEAAMAWSDTARAKNIDNRPPQELVDANGARTIALLVRMYEILGCPAVITSFYRCPSLNAAVGGQVNPPSAHMDLRAVDSIPKGRTVEECFSVLKMHAEELDYDQLIIEHDKQGHVWLHGSVAKDGHQPRHMAFTLEKKPENPRTYPG